MATRRGSAVLRTLAAATAIALCGAASGQNVEARRVVVETIDEQHVGELVSLGPHTARLQGDTFLSLPVDSLLRITFDAPSRKSQIDSRAGESAGSVTLVDGSRLAYSKCDLDGDQLQIVGPGSEFEAEVPLAAVAEWWLGEPLAPIDDAASADTLWIRSRRSPQPRSVDGVVVGVDAQAVRFALDPESVDEAIDVPWERVAGIRFFRGAEKASTDPACWIDTVGGSRVAARTYEAEQLESLRWESPHSRGAAAMDRVAGLDLSAGRVAPVSTLAVVESQWRPYFAGEESIESDAPYRLDAALGGEPLALRFPDSRLPSAWPQVAVERRFRRGVALRSEATLVFATPDGPARLKGFVGLDPAAVRVGDTVVTILAGDRVVFTGRVDGQTRPVELNAPLEGAKTLTLSVGFGENLDTGDRVHFADLRVIQ